MIIEKKQIEELLPHRKPFLFLDKCNIIEVGKKGIGYKTFLSEDYFFQGHFPDMPIVPGVILIESLAQTAGVVVSKGFSKKKDKSVLFMSISSAKFRQPVFPNDEILFNVDILNKIKSVYKFYGVAKKGSKKVCEAIFSAMIIEKNNKEIF